ncbi:unnamed protein product [Gongylonema pulchrum]|uniref:Uncharacterized protein n=1 Tax=Gongylonema pulchrum TaxID=637853 RepID=A0A183DVX5_9BILA|nr:unnamed protein product [Gongylonema pulchrum]
MRKEKWRQLLTTSSICVAQARKEYERQLSLSYTAQQQGMLLRDNSSNLMPTSQPSATLLYPPFSQQTVT